MVSPKIGPSFFGENYEKYVSELTTEGTIAGENLTPEERKEGFKKKGDKIDFKNFLEKVLERLPPDAQKKITEGEINRVNFDRYEKKISVDDVRKDASVNAKTKDRDIGSESSGLIAPKAPLINPEQLFNFDEVVLDSDKLSSGIVKAIEPEVLKSEVTKVIDEQTEEEIPDDLDDLLKDIREAKEKKEDDVKVSRDDKVLANIKETNKNLLETNEILYGLIKSLQKEMVEDKKKAFKEKDRLRKEQRKASFASAGTGRRLIGPKLRKPRIGVGGLFDNPLFKFLGLSALAGLVEFIPKIVEFIETLPERINKFITEDIPNFIGEKFTELRNFLGEKFSEIGTTISEKFNEFRTFVGGFFNDRFKEIKQFFEDIYDGIDEFTGGKLTEFIEGIKGLGPMIVEKSQEFYKTVDDWTGGRISGAFDWIGKNVIDPMGAFFKEKIDYVGTKAGELWSNFSSSFLNFFGDIKFELPDLGVTELTSNVLGLEPAGGVRVAGDERDYLKRLMIAEAGGEGEVGMAAVGRSVMNRAGLIQSGKVGAGTFNANSGSITDVINASGQYQPVREGKLNRQLTPEEDARAERALQMAENQEKFTAGLKSEGVTSEEDIKKISASTGFRTGSAKKDSSQNVNTTKLGGHIFNTAGNADMTNAYSEINFVGDNTKHGTPGAGIPADPGFKAGAGDKSKRIFLHWTAHDHNTPFNNYHTTFLGDGKAVRNTENYGVYKGTHTGGGNTNSVGLAIAAAGGAKEGQTLGKYPPTGAQLNAMALEAARLAVAWGWDASTIDKNVMTHGEWERKATGAGILPGKPQRWDLDQLFSPSEKIGSGKSDGGNYMRKLIKKYYVQLKSGGSQQEQPRRQPSAQPVSRALTTTLDNVDAGVTDKAQGRPPVTATTPLTNQEGNNPYGMVVTSEAMKMRSLSKSPGMHMGVDIANGKSGAPLQAFTDGVITGNGKPSAGYGNWVSWTDTAGLEHFYAHMEKATPFKVGDKVKAGTQLGTVGNTGRSTGPHLHWETSTTPGDTGRPKGSKLSRIDPLSKYAFTAPFGGTIIPSQTAKTTAPKPAPTTITPAPSRSTQATADSVSRVPSRASRSRVNAITLPPEVRNNPILAGSSGQQSSSTENYVPRVSTRTSSDIYQINTRALFNIVG